MKAAVGVYLNLTMQRFNQEIKKCLFARGQIIQSVFISLLLIFYGCVKENQAKTDTGGCSLARLLTFMFWPQLSGISQI